MRTTRTLHKTLHASSVGVQYAVTRRGVPSAAALRAWARSAGGLSITIRVVGRAEARRLNREFRKKDYATNVLSFPYGRSGDIVLCHPVIAREAREQGKSVRAHYAHLVLHGMLHLRGYAHGKDMEAREIRLLRRLGFRNPYTVESCGTA
jgi:probable rRNA maturation factor